MKNKMIVILMLLLFPLSCFAANEWKNADTAFMDGDSVNFNDIDTNVNSYILEPIDRILPNLKFGMEISYSSASQLSVAAGSIGCSNSGGTINKIRRNSSSTTVTWSDIDTGAEASATTYYVYANCDADATTATFNISTSSSAPSGVTSYRQLGSFVNDSNSNITAIINNGFFSDLGIYQSKSNNTTYQALTDGIVAGAGNSGCDCYADASSPPTTAIAGGGNSSTLESFSFPVPKGYYWKVNCSSLSNLYWTPFN